MINFNSQLTQELRDVCKIQGGKDRLNDQVGNIIQPVIDINPKHARRINIVRRGTSAATIYTTPANKDFFLVGWSLNCISTAAGSNGITLTATPKGEAAVIIDDIYLLNTVNIDAANGKTSNFPAIPILLERNTAIVLAVIGTTTSRTAIIFGYEIDNANA